MANPFKPTAGKMPPDLIGRQNVIDDFTRGLRNGAGAPERLMFVTGQRGFGKTVMLTQLREVARSHGWEAYAETASADMVSRLVARLRNPRTHLDGVTIAPSVDIAGMASVRLGEAHLRLPELTVSLRDLIRDRMGRLPAGKGVLITVDESQAASREDLVALAITVQHIVADEDERGVPDDVQHGIALVIAGLPIMVDDLVNDDVLTFLRRAQREVMGPISIPEVRNAFVKTFEASGRQLGFADAEVAAEATGGNPYLVQLVGYYTWEVAEARGSSAITREDVEQGASDAIAQYAHAVCEPTYYSLTRAQQGFLDAMAEDYPEPSAVADVAIRLGKSSSWVGRYRASLVSAQVVEPAGRGRVRYAIPRFGDWMRELVNA